MLHVDRDAEAHGRAMTAVLPAPRTTGDRVMRKVLLLPDDGPAGTPEAARKAFQTSIMVAAVRCVLMYLVFPFVLPAIGVAKGVGPAIGLVINLVAMTCIFFSMRRFWRAEHPKRWWYAALGGTVVFFLVYLSIDDIVTLAT